MCGQGDTPQLGTVSELSMLNKVKSSLGLVSLGPLLPLLLRHQGGSDGGGVPRNTSLASPSGDAVCLLCSVYKINSATLAALF